MAESDLEILCLSEDLLVSYLEAQNIPWVQRENGLPQRIYRGFENTQVQSNKSDIVQASSETDSGVSDGPTEGSESSVVRLPCIIVSCDLAECISPEFDANYNVQAEFEVVSNSFDSTTSDHRSRVRDLLRILMRRDLAGVLTEFSVGTFHSPRVRFGKLEKMIMADSWVHRLTVELLQACGNEVLLS